MRFVARGTRARSASSGRFVTKAHARQPPRMTVVETTGGSGTGRSRSASTGRFVKAATARRNPGGTVTEA